MGIVICDMFCDPCSFPKKDSWYLLWRAQFEHQKKSWSIPKSFCSSCVVLLMCCYSCADTSIGIPSIGHGVPKNIFLEKKNPFWTIIFFRWLENHGISMCQLPNQFRSKKQCFRRNLAPRRQANFCPGEVDTMTRRVVFFLKWSRGMRGN